MSSEIETMIEELKKALGTQEDIYESRTEGGPTVEDKWNWWTYGPSKASLEARDKLELMYQSAMHNRNREVMVSVAEALGYPRDQVEQDEQILVLLERFESGGSIEDRIDYLSYMLHLNKIVMSRDIHEEEGGFGAGGSGGPHASSYYISRVPDTERGGEAREQALDLYVRLPIRDQRYRIGKALGLGDEEILANELKRGTDLTEKELKLIYGAKHLPREVRANVADRLGYGNLRFWSDEHPVLSTLALVKFIAK